MDQAAEQEVDLHEGLENTLKILGHKLTNVTLTRQFDRSVPRVRVVRERVEPGVDEYHR